MTEPIKCDYIPLYLPFREPMRIIVPREMREEYMRWAEEGVRLYLKAVSVGVEQGSLI